MSHVHKNILSTIGNTPLVQINALNTGLGRVLAKVEFFNPGGSVKDRVGLAMLESAEASGLIKPGAVIVEPTSGNTGIGLAVAAAVKGYRLILTMPETMSVERRKLLAAYGAELVLTDGSKGMNGAIDKAREIAASQPNSFIPQQFENPVNPETHFLTTGREIWNDTDGQVAAFVAGVGTGGTLSGVARYLKQQNPSVHIVAVEPADSAVLSGGKSGTHKLQGIGAGFIPKTLDTGIIDQVITVTSDQAGQTARSAARREGILIGISSGAALWAALQLAQQPRFENRNIVVLLPDTGERYLSSWLFDQE